ncbi:hypothetical protein R50073_45070 [Maricurvus nonylphenolicus]|uniref:glutathione S-transferase N-terminal domain-containing protein n=1 Tax=Maricurvus nonylphenolicus TaxID=1008307 RepID=UPI0036F3CDBB
MGSSIRQDGEYIIYGMFSSYFTKKLEAYFLAKGIAYRYVEMDAPSFVQVGEKVGVVQLPQVQCPDGSWLTDTTLIMEHFEQDKSLPALQPEQPLAAFLSEFLEDCFDEWLWTPALYYRWAFKMDRLRRSEEFTYSIGANGLYLPRFLNRLFLIWRQLQVHIKNNGVVSKAHARNVEEFYLQLLDMLQPIFEKRPFLFGERPCAADFGLFGPMFPHFSCDPTPQEIMHVRAPHVFRWIARLWSTRPAEVSAAAEIKEMPEDLQPLLAKMAGEYLPYLVENQKAFSRDDKSTSYALGGLQWQVKTAPYRVYCLAQLQTKFQRLSVADQAACESLLGRQAISILTAQPQYPAGMEQITASQPLKGDDKQLLTRLWQDDNTPVEKLFENRLKRRPSKAAVEIKRQGTSWLPHYFRRYRA